MEVIIATEGLGEYAAFKRLFASLPTSQGSLSPRVLHVTCQPDGPTRGIAKKCEPLLRQARARNADLFVLVIDRERQDSRAGELAQRLQSEIDRLGPWPFRVEVVYKDRTFENWLVADLGALRRQPARYEVTSAMANQIEPDKADRVNALALLKKAAKARHYEKIEDGKRIVEHMSVEAAARNSRSLRHLLHVLGHTSYQSQCRRAKQPGPGPQPAR
jgi:hypothetical protein